MVKNGWVSPLFVVWVASFGYVLGSNIPSYIHICHRSDPKVAGCIRKSVEALRPQLMNGIPEIDVPGIDPFKLDKIVIFDGKQTPNLEAYLDNVEARGLSSFQITKLKLDVDKKTYRVGVKIPAIDMEGLYKIDAKILGSQLKSSGKFYANATSLDGQVLIQAAIGKGNHLVFDSMAFKLKIGDFNINTENFHSSDAVIGQAARELLKTNKEEILQIATPRIEAKCSEILLVIANKITQNLDYDEVFPL